MGRHGVSGYILGVKKRLHGFSLDHRPYRYEHDVLLQFMTPLSVIFLKSISALNMISLRLTVIIENRVINSHVMH